MSETLRGDTFSLSVKTVKTSKKGLVEVVIRVGLITIWLKLGVDEVF